jgi:lipoxygenase homology domain-containing protein 1
MFQNSQTRLPFLLLILSFASSLWAADYKVRLVTGGMDKAGTSAFISLRLIGTKGEHLHPRLNEANSKSVPLVRGEAASFMVHTNSDLGALTSIEIGHDNTGNKPGWYLEEVEISSGQQTYSFPCQRWFADDADDRQIRRTLYPRSHPKFKSYKISIQTGTKGTNLPVRVTFHGQGRSIHFVQLDTNSNNFEKNSLNTFYLHTLDLGTIYKLDIDLGVKEKKGTWSVVSILISDRTTDDTVFRWNPDGRPQVLCEAGEQINLPNRFIKSQ